MQQAFSKENIDARVFFYPLSGLPMFRPQPENVHAWNIPGRAINLPSDHEMSEGDLERVIGGLKGPQGRRWDSSDSNWRGH